MAKKKANNLEKTIAIFSIVFSVIMLALIIPYFIDTVSNPGNCVVTSPLNSFVRIIGLGLVLISGILRYRNPLSQHRNALLIAGIIIFFMANLLGADTIIYECNLAPPPGM